MGSAHTMLMTNEIPRFQRKRSYDDLLAGRRAKGYDSDESGSTVPFSAAQAPPAKMLCNCEHMPLGCEIDHSLPLAHPEVFLGGACGSSTWRRDIAIPALEENGTTFYNPQLEAGAWHSGLIAVEAEAKEKATVLLVVVENVPEGTLIAGELVSENERKDLNRGREYLRSVVQQRIKEGHTNVELCSSISDAVMHAAKLAKVPRRCSESGSLLRCSSTD